MSETIKGIVKHRRKTAADWILDNTVLLDGEIAIETDTKKIKIGDGTNGWNALPYLGDPVE